MEEFYKGASCKKCLQPLIDCDYSLHTTIYVCRKIHPNREKEHREANVGLFTYEIKPTNHVNNNPQVYQYLFDRDHYVYYFSVDKNFRRQMIYPPIYCPNQGTMTAC